MIRTYRYRIYPTPQGEQQLNAMLAKFCQLYNAGLEERIDRYRKTGESFGYTQQANQLKECRSIDPEGLGKYSFSALQQVLRRLNKSYNNFFGRIKRGEKKVGFPRFKSAKHWDTADFRFGDGMTIKQDKLRIVGIDEPIKVRWHRKMPKGVIGQASISRNGGHWHALFTVETEDVAKPAIEGFNPVGVDMGVDKLIAYSDGVQIDNPKWVKSADAKLRRLNRALARKVPHSSGWKKAKQRLRRHYSRTVCKRNDFLHKLSFNLVKGYSHIAIEDLNIKGLARGFLAREVLDAGWGKFFSQLQYKAESANVVVESVNPNGTSQKCICNADVPKTLNIRIHKCPSCGYFAPRDVCSAQVILNRASFMRAGLALAPQSKSEVRTRLGAEAVCFS